MSPDPFRRLRVELSLWYAGVFAVILLGFGLATYAYLAVALMHDVDSLNRMAYQDLRESLSVEGGVLRVRPATFHDEWQEMRATYRVRLVRVVAPDGRVLAQAGIPGAAIAPEGPVREVWHGPDGDLRLLRQPVEADGRRLGTVVFARPLDERDDPLHTLLNALLVAIPVAVGVTLVAGALLAGKALAPTRDAFERQRRFIADASHELRTPLAVIQMQAEVGQQGDAVDARRALGVVERTARRMGKLASDLLFLTRADARSLTLERRRFYLDELAEQTVGDLAPLAAERGLALVAELAEADLAIEADPEKIQQLLTILIDNALAYTPAPGRIVVRVAVIDHQAELSVADTGPGVPPEALERVFDRFFRVDTARAPGGSGLGLAIARAIAHAHGGTLTLESAPGRGATFRCRLPLA